MNTNKEIIYTSYKQKFRAGIEIVGRNDLIAHANDNHSSPPLSTPPAHDNTGSSARFSLYQGCCMETLAKLPDNSVNLIATDLPYGTTACAWDSLIDLEAMWREVIRVLKPNGIFISTASQPFTTVLAASNLAMLKYALVWEKTRSTGFLQANQRHLKKHEDILIFSPGTSASGDHCRTVRSMTYNPQGLVELEKPLKSRNGNMEGGHLSYARNSGKKDMRRTDGYLRVPKTRQDGSEITTFNGRAIFGERKQTHTNYPTSVLKYASEPKPQHQTQKPVPLYENLVRTFSNPGDVVMDICMGSGTTGVAVANIGDRSFIGIERDPTFFAIAKERVNAAGMIETANDNAVGDPGFGSSEEAAQ